MVHRRGQVGPNQFSNPDGRPMSAIDVNTGGSGVHVPNAFRMPPTSTPVGGEGGFALTVDIVGLEAGLRLDVQSRRTTFLRTSPGPVFPVVPVARRPFRPVFPATGVHAPTRHVTRLQTFRRAFAPVGRRAFQRTGACTFPHAFAAAAGQGALAKVRPTTPFAWGKNVMKSTTTRDRRKRVTSFSASTPGALDRKNAPDETQVVTHPKIVYKNMFYDI